MSWINEIRGWGKKQWGIAIGVLLALTITVSGQHGKTETPNQRTAVSSCETAMDGQLTAPATAHYHNVSESNMAGGINVVGQVDSENAYGALLTTDFTCDTDSSGTNVLDVG